MTSDLLFWERPEIVERFAAREPDRRLMELAPEGAGTGLRSLDVGCAAGRNSRYLAELGADVWALDASHAMVAATRAQLAEVLGPEEAARRVLEGEMQDLGRFQDASFELVVLLGVLQNAGTDAELHRALDEVRRVVAPGGRCLVANFAPGSEPSGTPLQRLQGETHVFTGFGGPHRRITLLAPDDLDAVFHHRGLRPARPTTAVRVSTGRGFRITVNALYVAPG